MGINTNRLMGLSSGFDTDTIVKNLMQIEQLKLNRHLRSKITYQWKQEALTSIASELTDFRQTYMSALSSSNMRSESVYKQFKATVSGANASAVTITANYSASPGSIKIDRVISLAKATKVASAGRTDDGGTGVSNSGELSGSNSATLGSLDFKNSLGFVDGKVSFSINDVEFTFSETDSLQSMMNTINASDAGVTMSYSRLNDSIAFTTKETGADTKIEIKNITGNAFGANGAFGINTGTHANGENAKAKIEGVTVERASNTFTVDGITYTLNSVMEEGDEPITVNITRDIDATVDTIKSFVDVYNSLIAKIDGLLSERKSTSESSYLALTDDEKANMTEKEIEQWESIAKKGILYSNSGLKGLLSGLRSALYEAVGDTGLSAADIGLRTGDWKNKGQITIDEKVLRAAIEKNPDQVMNVLAGVSSSSDPSKAYKENGLMSRISDLMYNYNKGIGQTQLDSIESSLSQLTTKISDMEKKMSALEEKYYLKYAAMEEALSKLSSQSDYITAMLSSFSSK